MPRCSGGADLALAACERRRDRAHSPQPAASPPRSARPPAHVTLINEADGAQDRPAPCGTAGAPRRPSTCSPMGRGRHRRATRRATAAPPVHHAQAPLAARVRATRHGHRRPLGRLARANARTHARGGMGGGRTHRAVQAARSADRRTSRTRRSSTTRLGGLGQVRVRVRVRVRLAPPLPLPLPLPLSVPLPRWPSFARRPLACRHRATPIPAWPRRLLPAPTDLTLAPRP